MERLAMPTPDQFKPTVGAAKHTLDPELRKVMQIYDLGSLATVPNGCIAPNLIQ